MLCDHYSKSFLLLLRSNNWFQFGY